MLLLHRFILLAILFSTLLLFSTDLLCQSSPPSDSILTKEAEAAFATGDIFRRQAKYDSASTAYKIARHKFELLGNAAQVVNSAVRIADMATRQGLYEQASELYEAAISDALSKLGINHKYTAYAYNQRGNLFQLLGKYQKALQDHNKSLEIREIIYGSSHYRVAQSKLGIANDHYLLGDLRKAIDQYNLVLHSYLELFGPQDRRVATVLTNLVIAHTDIGDFKKAHEDHHRSIKIYLASLEPNHPAVANSYMQQGRIFYEEKDYKEAFLVFEKALDMLSTPTRTATQEVAYANYFLGILHQETGNFAQSLLYLERAVDIWQSLIADDNLWLGGTHREIGRVYAALSDYANAHAYFLKAEGILQSSLGEMHDELALLNDYQGAAFLAQNELSEAAATFRNMLRISKQRYGEHHQHSARARKGLANVLQARKQYAAAAREYERAIKSSFQNNKTVTLSPLNTDDVHSPAVLRGILQDYASSQEARAASKGIATSRKIVHLHKALNLYATSIELTEKINAGFRSEGSRLILGERSYEQYAGAVRTARMLYETTMDEQFLHRAFVFAEQSRSNTLAQMLRESKARSFAGIPDSLINEEQRLRGEMSYYQTQLQKERQKGKEKNPETEKRFRDHHFQTKMHYDALIARLAEDYPRYYQLKHTIQRTTVADIQSALEPQTALVEYFLQGDQQLAFLIDQANIEMIALPAHDSLSNKVQQFLASIGRFSEREHFTERSHQLYQQLVAPLNLKKRDYKNLIIIQDGPLSRLPFESLIAAGEGSDYTQLDYLVRHHDIRYHYSANLWAESQQQTESRPQRYFGGFAPVFAPEDKSLLAQLQEKALEAWEFVMRDNEMQPLLESANEVQNINALLQDRQQLSKYYLRENASEANFKNTAASYEILHLATHSFVNYENTALSGIAFAPPFREETGEDGILYASEIYQLNLNANLVVLSSCESGKGKYIRGEGVMAMPRGFLYAGVPNIVMSLWRVSDTHTRYLMETFYRELDGNNYATALRQAKLKMLEDPETALPMLWSGFVLIGR